MASKKTYLETDAGAETAAGETAAAETPATETDAGTETAAGAAVPAGIWVYIGPSLRGLVATGKLYRGTRAEALEQAAAILARAPEAGRLIVPGKALTQARARARTPGNALYETYQALAKKEKEGRIA